MVVSMYETKMISDKLFKIKCPKLECTAAAFNGMEPFGETTNEIYWCLCGKFGIVTDKSEKRVLLCSNVKLSSNLFCSISEGQIYLFQNIDKKIHIDKLIRGKDIDMIYRACLDRKQFPLIERIIKRYLRYEIKQRYIVEI